MGNQIPTGAIQAFSEAAPAENAVEDMDLTTDEPPLRVIEGPTGLEVTYAILYQTEDQLQALLKYAQRWERVTFSKNPAFQQIIHVLETKRGRWLASTGARGSGPPDAVLAVIAMTDLRFFYKVRARVILAEGQAWAAGRLGQLIMVNQVFREQAGQWLNPPLTTAELKLPTAPVTLAPTPTAEHPLVAADSAAGLAADDLPYWYLLGVRTAAGQTYTGSFGPHMARVLWELVPYLPAPAPTSPSGLQWFAVIVGSKRLFRFFEYQIQEGDGPEETKRGQYYLLYPDQNKIIILARPKGDLAPLLDELAERYPYLKYYLCLDVGRVERMGTTLATGRLWGSVPLPRESRGLGSAMTVALSENVFKSPHVEETYAIAKAFGYTGEPRQQRSGHGVGVPTVMENKELLQQVAAVAEHDWSGVARRRLPYYALCGALPAKSTDQDRVWALAETTVWALVLIQNRP